MSTPQPPPLYQRRSSRSPLAPIRPLSGKGGKVFVFAVLAVLCGAGAAYMALVQRMPLTDMRVVAPAIGALWFGLRVFISLTPKV
ncbi:MAG: hypothetical protein KF779_05610 [Hyphomonadaceae bacterium]|nr:hypothetical protein [Hyphomonadaceae bacterium]